MIMAGTNFIFLNAVAAVSIGALVKGLVSTHQKKKELTQSLEKERFRLTKAKGKLELEVKEREQAKEGSINIALRSAPENKFELIMMDDGIGMPEEIDIATTDSVGLYLVFILVESQLHGEIKMHRTEELNSRSSFLLRNNFYPCISFFPNRLQKSARLMRLPISLGQPMVPCTKSGKGRESIFKDRFGYNKNYRIDHAKSCKRCCCICSGKVSCSVCPFILSADNRYIRLL